MSNGQLTDRIDTILLGLQVRLYYCKNIEEQRQHRTWATEEIKILCKKAIRDIL